MEEKKIVGYLAEELSERGVFVQDVSINYDDKFVIYSRGVEKTEIIDGERVVGKKPKRPYFVNEIDKKTKKRKIYVVELFAEEDVDDEEIEYVDATFGQIVADRHPDFLSLSID